MNEWKQAWWLAMFEVKASLKGIHILIFLALVFGGFFAQTLTLEDNSILLDFFFLGLFWSTAILGRPKEFQYQKVDEEMFASPFVVMLQQLPIPKSAIVNSRFIVYFLFSIPYHLLIMILIYVFAPNIREMIPNGSYFVFTLVWICFGMMFGSIFPVVDIGDKVSKNKWFSAIYSILFFGGIIAIVGLINIFTEKSIVSWSIHASLDWPLLTALFSVLATFLTVHYDKKYMIKKIDQNDYLR